MEKYIINGGKGVHGEIAVRGAKNAALKIIPASILLSEKSIISNLPLIEDVYKEITLIENLGARTALHDHILTIETKEIKKTALNPELATQIRASINFVAPLLTRFGEVTFPHPGGDVIGAGTRPIDMFLEGFQKMGAELTMDDSTYTLKASGLKAIDHFFYKVSVTVTEAFIMAATLAKGTTTLRNCAMEPEIPALADFLNSCGAKISGAGTPSITIEGVKSLTGGEIKLIPDRLETGTFAILAAALHSELKIIDCNPKHIEALLALFARIGIPYEADKTVLTIKKVNSFKAHDAITHEYPGFATDLQSPYTVLMTQAEGTSIIFETIYDRRLIFTDSLVQMGAKIVMADPHRVIISGPSKLHGRKLISPDVRAGIALVITGLVAKGTTSIENIYQINRGYENIVERLQSIGADITQTSN